MPARPLSEETQTKLLGYSWPGNVRELENAFHRAILLSTGDVIGPEAILLSDSPLAPGSAAAANTATGSDAQNMVGKTVSEVERELIINTLGHCLGNRTHAANILGISIRTLRNKLKQYNQDGFNVPSVGGAVVNRPLV